MTSQQALTPGVRCGLLIGTAAVAVTAAVLLPAVPQPVGYHDFADARTFAGIPNALNVISNVALLFAGGIGLHLVVRRHAAVWRAPIERWAYALFFLGVALTAFGSGYYHWAPDNERLAWDRLPMTIAIMSLVAAQVAERVHRRIGEIALGPLVVIGAASVLYWLATERSGQGNVLPYVVLHAYAILIILLIVSVYPPRYTGRHELRLTFAAYAVAKLGELLDGPIFALGHVVSGHTVKHLAAALAAYWLYCMLQRREVLPAGS